MFEKLSEVGQEKEEIEEQVISLSFCGF
jgi:hypothetical protein